MDSNPDLKLHRYHFDLPSSLIAQRPHEPRSQSRLMVYDKKTDQVTLTQFSKIGDFLPPDSNLIFNQSKVYPARLMGSKPSGGKGEIFVLSLDQAEEDATYPCLLGFSGRKNCGQEFHLAPPYKAIIKRIGGEGIFHLTFSHSLQEILNKIGKVPIPPYIRGGESDEQDLLDYQTVYAKTLGSVAAPTAGLHFDEILLKNLEQQGIQLSHVCLHVGMGTFAPVKSEDISSHKMHEERFFVEASEWNKISSTRPRIAVGTTSLRTLESIYQLKGGQIEPGKIYSTDIFLHPGKEIQSVSGLITNFHLPKSSLLMLVSALIGREKLMSLYELAIKERFRFYSYGDAMCVLL